MLQKTLETQEFIYESTNISSLQFTIKLDPKLTNPTCQNECYTCRCFIPTRTIPPWYQVFALIPWVGQFQNTCFRDPLEQVSKTPKPTVRDPWYQVSFSHYQVLGTTDLVPSTWYQVLGTKYLVPSTWYQVLSTKYLVPSTWYQVLGTKYLVPSTWYQVPGTWYKVRCIQLQIDCRQVAYNCI